MDSERDPNPMAAAHRSLDIPLFIGVTDNVYLVAVS
jgi:hypothetical protein